MDLINIILVYGLVTSLLLSVLILTSLYIQPRIWIQKLPEEVQISISPKTKKEKKQTYIVLILFLSILLALPIIAVTNYGSHPTLLETWVINFSIYFLFNLTDLLIIDWLIVCTITPGFLKIKGVDIQVYKNYLNHLQDFFKGIILIAVLSILSSLISYFISQCIHR